MIGIKSGGTRETHPCRRRGERCKILAVHRYYWPDTPPYAAMLRRIVSAWQEAGHQVEVLSSQPSYKAAGVDNERRPSRDVVDGVVVDRMTLPNETSRPLLRIINALRLGSKLLWKALTRRYDVIMISTSPPVLGGVAAALASKLTRTRFIYHCMDIHPEVGKISGEFSNPFLFRILSKLDQWTCHQADPVIVLSEDMAKTLRERPKGDRLSIQVLNNFSLPTERTVPSELPFDWPTEAFTVLFAGNVGRFQGLDTVVEAMGRLHYREDIAFVMMGEGVVKSALQARAIELGARIYFVGHQPVEIAKAAMRVADAGYISLAANIYRYAYPSKTMTYLEQGCPLLVAVEPESELASEVVAGGYGHAIPPGDIPSLVELLEELADTGGNSSHMKVAAKAKAQQAFSEEVVLEKWNNLMRRDGRGKA